MKKMVSGIMLTLLLVCLVSGFSGSMVKRVASVELPSAYPLVYVYPESVTANVGDYFTISVIVYNLTDARAIDPDFPLTTVSLGNLYGFDIQLSWDPNIIKYVNHTITAPFEMYPEPVPPSPYPGILHGYGPNNQTVLNVLGQDIVNESGNIPGAWDPRVRAWFAYVTMYPATPFNGNGTIFTMTFQLIKAGESPIEIVDCILADKDGYQIARGSFGTWLNPPRNGVCRSVGVPIVTFTYWPEISVVGKPVHFEAAVTGNETNITTYVWDFGDGTKMNTTTPTVEYNYTTAGTPTVSLKVVDTDGVESVLVTQDIKVAEYRDLEAAGVSLSQHSIRPNRTLTIDVVVGNVGSGPFSFDENCSITLYYNASSVNWGNVAATSWIPVGSNQTLVMNGVWKLMRFRLNSSELPTLEAYYYILANVTGIPNGYEANITNNVKISDAFLYTNQIIHEPAITAFKFGFERAGALKLPVIEGENTTFHIAVKNDGNEIDKFNITLYANSSVLKTWQTSELQPGETQTITWKCPNPFDFGYYNLTVDAEVDGFVDTKQGWLHVIKPPKLIVEITPESPIVNQTATFNASKSMHQDPEGIIVYYAWWIYAPGIDPMVEPPTATFAGPDLTIINYNFTQVGNWTIILETTDNYGLRYDLKRIATADYMLTTKIVVVAPFTIPGDVNYDGVANISDIISIASIYNCEEGDPNWNPNADLAPPYGKIDILDLVTCAYHYGETYP
jgi:PKD repeat protein